MKNVMTEVRRDELFEALLFHVVESTPEEDLLDVLHGIGFCDDEIKACDIDI